MSQQLPLGPLIIDVAGITLTEEDKQRLLHPLVGGVILFTRNYENPEQIKQLIQSIQQLRAPRLLITVDHEGGRVQRWEHGFTRIPPMATLGELFDKTPALALERAFNYGQISAKELVAVGVDLNFAPVLDLDYCKDSDLENKRVLRGGRAFDSEPNKVAILAEAYIKGLNSAGMKAIGKHFPGHGAVILDSHFTLPTDARDFSELTQDIYPFKKLIQQRLLAGVMTAHILYPALNNAVATLSSFWINTILRQQLGFTGTIISDDVSMQALCVVGDYPERVRLALQAGCHLVLLCNNPAAVDQVLGSMDAWQNTTSKIEALYSH